ncbi:MAG TPA: hypothetical protein VMT35_01785 [Ignavibacteriaceae bacterium]|nr:hypothetical protein [Ignavibacteriaceae bacterium]
MNSSIKYSLIIISFIFISFSSLAQEINVNEMIGKNQSAVIKRFGTPVHQDNSNPAMECMFYQSDLGRKIFVSSDKVVFQAESYSSYGSEKSARKTLDSFISSSIASGYQVDTVSANDFRLRKTGIKVDLQLNENKLSKKFEITVKANKTES